MDISTIISLYAFGISIIVLIIQILNHIFTKRKTFPSLKVYRFPPYDNENEDSLIIFKNIGTSIAYKISVILKFSYTEKELKLDIEKEYFLFINESLKKYIMLPEPRTTERFYIEIEIKFAYSRRSGETTYTERVYSDEYLIILNNE